MTEKPIIEVSERQEPSKAHVVISRPWKEHFKAASANAFLATIFMAGFGVVAAIWSSSLAPVQTELSRIREDRDRSQSELNQVKSEYAIYRSTTSPPIAIEPPQPLKSGGGAMTGHSGTTDVSRLTKEESVQTVRVTSGNTGEAFGGEVLISLVATPFEYSPVRHTVVASIGSPGFPSVQMSHKDVGYTVQLKNKRKFEIRVTSADTFDATFRVTAMDK